MSRGAGGGGQAWQLVARREVMVKLTDRAFLVGTAVTLALIAGLLTLQGLLSSRTKDYTLAAAPDAVTMAQAVRSAAGTIDDKVRVTVREVPDDRAGRAAVADESADAWLHPAADDGWALTTKSAPNDALEPVVAQVVRDRVLTENAQAAGTSAEALLRGTVLSTAQIEGDTRRAGLVDVVSFAFAFLFYLAALMFGVTLASSVVEEKQSRIVEIIATAIPVRQLLAGKIVGNTVLAVGQLVLYLAVGLVGLAFTEYSSLVTGLSGPVLWFVAFFLAGFVALACLWAVAGSLASRSEDLQSTATPLTMLLLAVFFSVQLLEGTARTVASFVPPVSAVLMPIRLLEGDAGAGQALVALALLLLAAAGTVLVGERLYRRSLLQTGGRVSMLQAWRAEE